MAIRELEIVWLVEQSACHSNSGKRTNCRVLPTAALEEFCRAKCAD